jgi:hypothetical protein
VRASARGRVAPGQQPRGRPLPNLLHDRCRGAAVLEGPFAGMSISSRSVRLAHESRRPGGMSRRPLHGHGLRPPRKLAQHLRRRARGAAARRSRRRCRAADRSSRPRAGLRAREQRRRADRAQPGGPAFRAGTHAGGARAAVPAGASQPVGGTGRYAGGVRHLPPRGHRATTIFTRGTSWSPDRARRSMPGSTTGETASSPIPSRAC